MNCKKYLALDSVFVLLLMMSQSVVYLKAQTPGKIPKWLEDGSFGDSVISESNGNIGIGTTSPAARLQAIGEGTVIGLYGFSNANIGVIGESNNFIGVLGQSTNSTGVLGTSTSGIGVRGVSSSGPGIRAESTSGDLIQGGDVFRVTNNGGAFFGGSVEINGRLRATDGPAIYAISPGCTGERGQLTLNPTCSQSSCSSNPGLCFDCTTGFTPCGPCTPTFTCPNQLVGRLVSP